MIWDWEFLLKKYFNIFQCASEKYSAKELMLKSDLVIVDYQSTSHLESLLMNIPTIFFWDSNAQFLDDQYIHFYDKLIEVGICQTNPVKAAKFIEEIKDNPQDWWQSQDVQLAKEMFLNENIGDPEKMRNYLMNFVKIKKQGSILI